MNNISFDDFYKQLEIGETIDETSFYFLDDEKEEEHYLGFLPHFEKPYWVGYCDIENGTEFYTAEELVNAKIFDGKSLKERWNQVCITSILGMDIEDWLEFFSYLIIWGVKSHEI